MKGQRRQRWQQRLQLFDTRALDRPVSFIGAESKRRDWSVVIRSYAGFGQHVVDNATSSREEADPVALSNSLQVEKTTLAASLDLHHLFLQLTTGPALDKGVLSGDGEGLRAWQSLVSRRDPKLRSRSAGILLELMRFDFTRDLLSKNAQNVSGKTLSSAIKVGMVSKRVGDSEPSHRVMKARRLKEGHDFETQVINITRARAAAAGAYTLTGKNTSNSGAQQIDVDAVSKGTGKGRGSGSRICRNCGKPGHLTKDLWSRKRKTTGG